MGVYDTTLGGGWLRLVDGSGGALQERLPPPNPGGARISQGCKVQRTKQPARDEGRGQSSSQTQRTFTHQVCPPSLRGSGSQGVTESPQTARIL